MYILNIKKLRLVNRWTQAYVGRMVGVSKQHVHDIEKGKKRPSYEVLCKLETLFEKKHDYLFIVNNQLLTDTPEPATHIEN